MALPSRRKSKTKIVEGTGVCSLIPIFAAMFNSAPRSVHSKDEDPFHLSMHSSVGCADGE